MLIKINNRKVVDSAKMPVVLLLSRHEIDIIKGWKGDEDMISSNPSSWSQEQSQAWLEKKKPELAALNATKVRNLQAQEKQLSNSPPVCLHGVVQSENSPGCPECKKIAEAMGVEKTYFETAEEIQKLGKDEDGTQW